MANDNFYSGATAVLPMIHKGEDTVHHVEVPTDTKLSDLHSALLDAGYQGPDIQDPNFKYKGVPYSDADKSGPYGWKEAQPTKEGSLEYDPKFKDAASKVWQAAAYGKNTNESGTYLDSNLDRGPISSSDQDGRMTLVIPKDAASTIHSHPNHFKDQGTAGGQPSGKDIETAKKLGKFVYVVSRSGLQYAGPHGETGVVYTNPNQFSQ